MSAYVEALCTEIEVVGCRYRGDRRLGTVYFGGGTPSLLEARTIARVLGVVARTFSLQDDCEITLEANPGDLTASYCAGLQQAGVNRISIGAQSAHESELRMFRRRHTWSDVMAAVQASRAGGFTNISIDLLYGVPGQTLTGWRDSLAKAVELQLEHISLYSLGLEPGTPLHEQVIAQILEEPDPDLVADMYDAASEYLNQWGFTQYEISNWAVAGHECVHNLQYWRRRPSLGLGAGAYGFVDEMRYGIVDSPYDYLARLNECNSEEITAGGMLYPAQDERRTEYLSDEEARSEMLFLGLRLLQEGVSRQAFLDRFEAPIEVYFGAQLAELHQRGMITPEADRILLAPHMRLIANRVFQEFV